MKTAIYIEDGLQQLVLQPENKFERNILKAIKEQNNEVEFHYGSFGSCQGGWIRHYNSQETNNETLMMVIKQNPEDKGKIL
ncbi:MAG: hypothetical protein SVR08_11880 [Spirochaetota bacterium]|nr:hypothetical protein [Spirochaetota bacterium]